MPTWCFMHLHLHLIWFDSFCCFYSVLMSFWYYLNCLAWLFVKALCNFFKKSAKLLLLLLLFLFLIWPKSRNRKKWRLLVVLEMNLLVLSLESVSIISGLVVVVARCRHQCCIVYTNVKEETVCFSPLCCLYFHNGRKEFHISRFLNKSSDQWGG